MEKIKDDILRKNTEREFDDNKTNKYEPMKNTHTYIQDIPNKNKGKLEADSKEVKRIKKSAGIMMGVVIGGIVLVSVLAPSSSGVNKSVEAEEALKTHMSTALGSGTILLSSDEKYAGRDVTITHKSSLGEATMDIWDYAAEDGDYVQVLVDGTPLGVPFMIKHEPVTFKIPAEGIIQVVGTRDGGGGITYGVYYNVNGTTYFNGTDIGGSNTYTLIRE